MNTIKVLIEGYASISKKGVIASSTVTLIRSNKINIIVDPGINRKLLLLKLEENNLKVDDIDFVFMTHTHADHNLLTGLFPDAKVIDNELIYDEDREIEHDMKVPGTNIEIINTPGHDQFHASLLVPTKEGKVVVAGDVFWWMDDEKQTTDKDSLIGRKDPYGKDEKALQKSRKLILEIADYIIPGHGKIFKNDKY